MKDSYVSLQIVKGGWTMEWQNERGELGRAKVRDLETDEAREGGEEETEEEKVFPGTHL